VIVVVLWWLRRRAALAYRRKRQAWDCQTKEQQRWRDAKRLADSVADPEPHAGADAGPHGHNDARRPPAAPTRPSICFQGAGCMVIYHVGVARYVEQHFELANARIYGASAGAIVAASLAVGLDLGPRGFVAQQSVAMAAKCRTPPFGPLFSIMGEVERALLAVLHTVLDGDEDVRQRCNGRLFISLTHLPTLGQRLLSHFPSREALATAVACSMNLPIFLCPLQRVEGEYYIDGGITDNSPRHCGSGDAANAATVCVSPTDPNAHVRPLPGQEASLLCFIVPGDAAQQRRLERQGWEDARRQHHVFLRNGWLPKVQSSAVRVRGQDIADSVCVGDSADGEAL
jgi:predicted acylesterase/phospholipase RssA